MTRFPFLNRLLEEYREWLTPRGRYLFWLAMALGLIGLNTKASQVFKVFAVVAALLVVAGLFAALRAPSVRFRCLLPERATAGRTLELPFTLRADGRSPSRPLLVSFPRPRRWGSSVAVEPRQSLVTLGEAAEDDGDGLRASVTLDISRRGRYEIPGPTLRATDPLGLVAGRPIRLPDQVVLVYPKFYPMESFQLPLGRRHQPGGIPLASQTGDSLEFLGTREYRPGDPIKHIHWRSWARVGEPVVMEFQEEYFARIALILDTFLPRKATPADEAAFEAAISVVASVADHFSRSEYIVDVFAAGPDLYEVSAGRSLAYLENILDVLACLEPCREPPFDVVGPQLFDKLEQITSVVVVVRDWDDLREDFLRRVRDFGVELRVLLVRAGATTKDWRGASEEIGPITPIDPDDVERALAAASAGDAA